MVTSRDEEVDRLMEFLRDRERCGRFHDVAPFRLAQALVPAADPHVFLTTPEPFEGEVAWAVDDALDKLLVDGRAPKLELAEIASLGLPSAKRVLAACIRTYSRSSDVCVFVEHFVPLAGNVDERCPTTLNGRMFLSYDLSLAIVGGVRRDQAWLTHRVGGLFTFTDAVVDFFPSPFWPDLFSWAPKPGNPLIWTREGREVAWFERRLGPFRRISAGDFIYRQPVLTRWTCAADEWDRIVLLAPRVPVRSVRLERASLGNS